MRQLFAVAAMAHLQPKIFLQQGGARLQTPHIPTSIGTTFPTSHFLVVRISNCCVFFERPPRHVVQMNTLEAFVFILHN
jgi:hypothetical protein